jgi:hypothetical protein
VAKKGQPKAVRAGCSALTPITARERKELDKSIEEANHKLRKKYSEIHNKVVDYVTHTVRGTTVFFTIHFKDRTAFSLRYTCDMFVVGTDLYDVKTGDYEVIREYMKPIPR